MTARILVVSFGLMAGGFARVAQTLLSHLCHRYELHHLVINHRGEDRGGEWQVYGNREPGDPQGLRALGALIETLRPHGVLILHDLYYQARYARCLKTFPNVARVAYVPIDGELSGVFAPQTFEAFDQMVAYTQFGHRQLQSLWGEDGSPGTEGSRPEICTIPHGVDTSVFQPLGGQELGDRREAKRAVFGEELAGADSFIVLNANRFALRKRIELTIEGFARFARGKPVGVRLCLHMASRHLGASLLELAQRHGIAHRLLLTHRLPVHPELSDDQLNGLYNACDVGINTSEGEGWGLVSFEHAATGAPQVVPAHSACAELWQDSACLVEPRSSWTCHQLQVQRHTVDPEDVAAALERLYADRCFRRRMAQAAFLNATREDYRWERIADRWDELFRRLLAVA